MSLVCKFIFLAELLFSCSDFEVSSNSVGLNKAIKISISDFKKTNLFKSDGVFSVSYVHLEQGILGISILASVNGLYPREDVLVGKSHETFPNRFVEVDQKLFYWNDGGEITKKTIEVLLKYDQIDSLYLKYPGIIKSVYSDSEEAMDYYFCLNNPEEFEKRKSTIAIGHYKMPVLNCK